MVRKVRRAALYLRVSSAKARGVRLGRPRTGAKVEAVVRARPATGEGIKKVAKAVGVGNGTVSRIRAAMKV
jgi:DNA invertase Pin-like site-specific DNA recombinase